MSQTTDADILKNPEAVGYVNTFKDLAVELLKKNDNSSLVYKLQCLQLILIAQLYICYRFNKVGQGKEAKEELLSLKFGDKEEKSIIGDLYKFSEGDAISNFFQVTVNNIRLSSIKDGSYFFDIEDNKKEDGKQKLRKYIEMCCDAYFSDKTSIEDIISPMVVVPGFGLSNKSIIRYNRSNHTISVKGNIEKLEKKTGFDISKYRDKTFKLHLEKDVQDYQNLVRDILKHCTKKSAPVKQDAA